jgi:hypothetical protein
MRCFIFLLLVLALPVTSLGEPKENSCDDPEINQQWKQTLTDYPRDPVLIKLSAMRIELCRMVKRGQVPSDTAHSTWEKALTTTILEQVRQEHEQRVLLRVFATF